MSGLKRIESFADLRRVGKVATQLVYQHRLVGAVVNREVGGSSDAAEPVSGLVAEDGSQFHRAP